MQRLVQQGFEEARAGGGGGAEAGFQLIAERHQGFDLGHDAVLFGEGGEGEYHLAQVYDRNVLNRHASCLVEKGLLDLRAIKDHLQISPTCIA